MGDSLILYRVINDDEYDELFKGIHREWIVNKYKISSKNNNTFNYSENINYMHFFKFAEHARERMSSFGNRLIMCDIPDNLIEQFGYGVYKHYDKENISVLIPEYFTNQIKIYLMILLFAIIHELGHLLIGIILELRI